jgi:cell division protein FtsB
MARGSAAGGSRPKQIPVALPPESASGSWLRNIRLSGFTFIMLSLIVVAVIVLAPSLRNIVEQQQQVAALEKALADKKKDVSTLKSDIDRWSDPAYIVAQARDRLIYVYPGDLTYLVIDDGKTVTTDDGAPISKTIQTTRVDWLRSLLSSVVTAGLTDQSANQLVAPTSGSESGNQ